MLSDLVDRVSPQVTHDSLNRYAGKERLEHIQLHIVWTKVCTVLVAAHVRVFGVMLLTVAELTATMCLI